MNTRQAHLLYIVFIVWGLSLNAQDDSTSFTNELTISTDNDALGSTNQSDRYYTFGMGIEYRFKAERFLGLQHLLKSKTNYFFEIGVRLEGFTPEAQDIPIVEITNFENLIERPFAGVNYASLAATYIFNRSFLKAQLNLGVLGPASGAEDVQRWFHDMITDGSTQDGWKFQLPNQLLVNLDTVYVYDFMPETSYFNFFGLGQVRGGTLFTDVSLEAGSRFGWFNTIGKSAIFGNKLASQSSNKELFFALRFNVTAHGYDATAQGNLFRSDNPLALDRINNFSTSLIPGIYFSLGKFSGVFEQYFTRGIVLQGERHLYGRLTVNYLF